MIQEEYFGFGSINKLESILEKEKVKNVFLVTGKKSYATSGAEDALNKLSKNYHVFRFHDFQENPKIEDVEKGIELIRKNNYDIIVAVGGGTVLDMAKLITILSAHEGNVLDYIVNDKAMQGTKVPLVAIPTTAGTGSEATHFAVVYINKKKYSVDHQSILPKYSILDPDLTMELPSYITASTGIDAFSQAIESYWSAGSTDVSRDYSKRAICLTLDNLVQAVNRPTKESRKNMLLASNLAGKAINISKTTAPHAISYAFTSYFGIPHGHAVGLTLGEIFFYNSLVNEKDVNDKRGVDYVREIFSELNNIFGCANADESRKKISKLMNECGLKTKLSELGVKSEDDIMLICNNVDSVRLKNNPRMLSREALVEILERIK